MKFHYEAFKGMGRCSIKTVSLDIASQECSDVS